MSKKNRDKNLVEKVGKLKDKQDKWMQERADSKTLTSKKFVHSTLRSSDSSQLPHLQQTTQKQQDVSSKAEAVPWTTNNTNYKGFVVRNGSGTSRSRKESSRTPSSNKTPKTFTHSSLKENVTSRPMSARSANFKHSKHKTVDANENVADEDSDESLSTSFTEHMSNLEFDVYDSKKYSKPNSKEGANAKKTKYMVNHSCPACKQIMLAEDRKPQMVFPCGHSFCGNCLKGKKKCLDCNTEIISYQTNESLLMVIQQFKQKIDREELELKEKQTRGFIDEYKNLNSRISILKGNLEIR